MGDLYKRDFIAWTEQQGRALREAAGRPTKLALDWVQLAEEIEDLGRSERRALASEVRKVIQHLLKLEFSAATEPRAGWSITIANGRAEIESLIEDDPGLRPRVTAIVRVEGPRAAKLAAQELKTHGEDEAAHEVARLGGDRYAEERILGDWLPGDIPT